MNWNHSAALTQGAIEDGFLCFDVVVSGINSLQAQLPEEAEEFDYTASIALAIERFRALCPDAQAGFVAAVAMYQTLAIAGEPDLPFRRPRSSLHLK